MDFLSSILNKAAANPNFKFHNRCKLDSITHLCFADDLLILAAADLTTLSAIKQGLYLFSLNSGLEPNVCKSNIFYGNVSVHQKLSVGQLMNFEEGSLPVTYLGGPLISTKLKAMDCKILADRLTARARSWMSRFLSFAGRLQLIQSTLFSMQVFCCGHFLLPATVIIEVEKVLRKFLWTGFALDKKNTKVKWETVCKPKSERGLGIKRLKDWNAASMLKYLGTLLTNKNSLWTKWRHANLLRGRSLWAIIPEDGNHAWTWRTILSLRPIVIQQLTYKLGNGTEFYLWFDPWLPSGPLILTIGDRAISASGISSSAKMNAIIADGRWRWPGGRSRSLIDRRNEIDSIPILQCDDSIYWQHIGGKFSIRSAWDAIRHPGIAMLWSKLIWFSNNIPKHSFCLWLTMLQAHKTMHELLRFGIVSNATCVFGCNQIEDSNHLFFNCNFTYRIWVSDLGKCSLRRPVLPWELEIRWASSHMLKKSFNYWIRIVSLVATVYHIWKERNNRIFNNCYLDKDSIITQIQKDVCLKACSRNRHIFEN